MGLDRQLGRAQLDWQIPKPLSPSGMAIKSRHWSSPSFVFLAAWRHRATTALRQLPKFSPAGLPRRLHLLLLLLLIPRIGRSRAPVPVLLLSTTETMPGRASSYSLPSGSLVSPSLRPLRRTSCFPPSLFVDRFLTERVFCASSVHDVDPRLLRFCRPPTWPQLLPASSSQLLFRAGYQGLCRHSPLLSCTKIPLDINLALLRDLLWFCCLLLAGESRCRVGEWTLALWVSRASASGCLGCMVRDPQCIHTRQLPQGMNWLLSFHPSKPACSSNCCHFTLLIVEGNNKWNSINYWIN